MQTSARVRARARTHTHTHTHTHTQKQTSRQNGCLVSLLPKYLRKQHATTCFAVSLLLSVLPHGTSRLPPDGFFKMPFMKLSLKFVDIFHFFKSSKNKKNLKWKPASFYHRLPGLVFVTETMFPVTYCWGHKSIWRKRIEHRSLKFEHRRFYVNVE